MNWTDVLLSVAALIVVGLAVYAWCIEPYRIRLNKIEIAIPDLPERHDGLTICHLSDTHTAKYGRLEKRIGEILAGIDADLCVITGDLLGRRAGIEALRRVLGSFKPRLGVFAVLGNGDYKLKIPVHELASDLERSGIGLLMNSHVTLSSNGEELHVIGVDDPFRALDELDGAMSGLRKDGLKLLLAHSPDILMKVADEPVDLVLAGHTHGGQVRLPFMRALWLHSRYHLDICNGYFSPQALSRILERDMAGVHLYVSRGLGSSGISARFMCAPEMVLITLCRRFEANGKRGMS